MQLAVLGERPFAVVRQPREDAPVAQRLVPRQLDELADRRVRAAAEQRAEIGDVLGQEALRVAVGNSLLHRRPHAVETLDVGGRQCLHREIGTTRLEQHAAVVELAHVLRADANDLRTLPGHDLDETLADEQAQRLADGGAADAGKRGQLRLGQARSRRFFTRDDPLREPVRDRAREQLLRPGMRAGDSEVEGQRGHA